MTADQEAILALTESNAKLHEALTEVMEWISCWDPNFIHDPEWRDTARKAKSALTT